jgi:uncharacterized membrane protein
MASLSHRRAGAGIWRARSRSVVLVVGPAVLVGAVLAWPMLFTTAGFGGDWEHHLWYVWRQSLAIRADGTPSLFLNTHYSVLYPQYAFYGGTIYVLAGTLAVALGDSPLSAYILTYILGFMAAYGGWYWIGRILGLGRLLAQVPALLFVTSACYLTVVYAQGDWPEFVAFSMLPLMLGSGLSVLRAERLRAPAAVALVVSSGVFFGSHIVTVLWASTLFCIVCVVLVVVVPEVRRRLWSPRLLRIAALVTPALLANAWFLLPVLAYSSHTRIGSRYGAAYTDLHKTMHLVAFHHLFTLSRATTAPGFPDYALALPTLAILWVLASIAILLVSVRRGAWIRILLSISAITAAIVVLMTHAGLILDLPKPYTLLQISYRLEGYVLMGVTASVLAVLVVLQSAPKRPRRWTWTIVPVLCLSVLGALQQLSAYPRTPLERGATFTSVAEVFSQRYDDYAYVPLPFVSETDLPTLDIPPAQVHDNHVSLTARVRPGQLVATNVGGGPNLLDIVGARVAGTDQRAQLVLAIGRAPASAAPRTPVSSEHISISPAQSAPVVIGRSLTLAAAAVLMIELAAFALWRYRDSRRRRSRGASNRGGVARARESETQVEPVDLGLP